MGIDLKSANSVKTGKKFSELRKELNLCLRLVQLVRLKDF